MDQTQYDEALAAKKATRRAHVLAVAYEMAAELGYQWISRDPVASRAKVAQGSIQFLFGSMKELKREVLREAIRREDLAILAQGLADGSPIAHSAPEDMKKRALAALTH